MTLSLCISFSLLSLCNTWENSTTLCDPDSVLTEEERRSTDENIKKQVQRLSEVRIQYVENASIGCNSSRNNHTTQDFPFYVLLARIIKTVGKGNGSMVNGNDLTAFGDEIVLKYELDRLACKSFVLLIAVEFAKLAYIRVGIELWFDKIVTYLIADWKGYAYTGRLNGTCFRRV